MQRLLPAVLVLIWGTPVYSSDASTDRVNIGVIGLAPYAFVAADGEVKGYGVDVTSKIREEVKLPGQDSVLPLKRLHRELLNDTVDCTILARVTISERRYEMLTPIGKEIESVVIPRAGIRIGSYSDLKELAIAVPRGVRLNDQFDADDSLNKFISNGYRQSALLLQRRRVDAIYGVLDSYLFNMRNIGMKRREIGKPYIFNKAPLWLMCRKNYRNEKVKKRLIEATDKIRDQGIFKEIIAGYLGERE